MTGSTLEKVGSAAITWAVRLTAILLLACGSSSAAPPATPAEVVQSLRNGGYVIFLRHALSNTTEHDSVDRLVLGDCTTQRNLTAAGRMQAIEIGKEIRRLGIPIAEVLASPYCRTANTAELAFVNHVVVNALVNTTNLLPDEKGTIVAELKELLGKVVLPGGNRVLVSHSASLADSVGIFPKPEGVIVVFRPNGDGSVTYIGTILPTDWKSIPSPK